ncbi:MAG: tetratricopeptide repeat protein [Candidatus Pacebacteria bacterium]|nr:tetratricopeptide repeat protein [Candidatus Paceibacterota bacterium]
MKLKLSKILVFILILSFFGSLLIHKIALPTDDLGRHIKNGEMVFKYANVFRTNFYSYTEPNSQFINHHWFFGVISYFLSETVGFGGMVIFGTIILLFTFLMLFFVSKKKADFWLISILSLPTILLLGERTDFRPEIFSYLFFVIFLYFLIDSEGHPNQNKIFWLIPIQLLWVNLHIFFFLGVILVLGFLLEKIILNRKNLKGNPQIKKLFFLLLFLIFVCFFNPNGIRGVLYPISIFNRQSIQVMENSSFSDILKTGNPLNISAKIFIPMVFLSALSFVIGIRKKLIFYGLASIGAAAASFIIFSRGVALFGLIFLPAVSSNLNGVFVSLKDRLCKKWPRVGKAAGTILIVVLIITFSYFISLGIQEKILKKHVFGIGLTTYSDSSAMFFKKEGLSGPIFNDFDIGSYLIYYLFPQEKVFVDNRPEAYSASFFKDVYEPIFEKEEKWQEMLEKYNFNIIFLHYYDEGPNVWQFLFRRMNDPQWSLVYADPYAVILLKNSQANLILIEKFGITKENAEKKLEYLAESQNTDYQIAAADLFNLLGRMDLSEAVFIKVVAEHPENGKIWMIIGEMQLAKNNPISAISYLNKAINFGQKTSEAYSFLGLAYFNSGQIAKARDALQKSLEINPDRQDAKNLFDTIEKNFPELK